MRLTAFGRKSRKRQQRPEPGLYGPDPGDASEEHALGELLDGIRQDVLHARRCPAVSREELRERLARAVMPGRNLFGERIPRALVRLALRLAGEPSRPGRHGRHAEPKVGKRRGKNRDET